MNELQIEAEFVSGKVKHRSSGEIQADGHGHAWVVFREKGSDLWQLLEATEKNPAQMLKPLETTFLSYFPKFSVNGELQTFRHYRL